MLERCWLGGVRGWSTPLVSTRSMVCSSFPRVAVDRQGAKASKNLPLQPRSYIGVAIGNGSEALERGFRSETLRWALRCGAWVAWLKLRAHVYFRKCLNWRHKGTVSAPWKEY